ncbi:MAG: dihydrodipicolinate reductase, partial [Novosphingobium sp.]
ISRDIDQDWEFMDIGWRVRIDGDAPMDITIAYPIAEQDYTAKTPGYTAHRAVNSVATVCAAAPGIRTTADMAQVIAQFS